MAQQIKLLGRLEIEEDGHPAPVMRYSKGCALLAYLIVTGQKCRREVVADLFWEASSTAQSLRNLRKLLHQLRPYVAELQVTRTNLFFQVHDPHNIDFLVLNAALADKDIARLDEALSLYRGELLDGFDLVGAPRFWEWLWLERERLRQRVWDAYHRICTTYYQEQTWQRGVETTRRWLNLDPLEEDTHQWLMKFLAANGQKSAALAQYETCRQLLWEELGVEPAATTVGLFKQIQELPDEISSIPWLGTNKPELPSPGELAEPGALPPHSFLPYHRNVLFTGRTHELQQLADTLLPDEQCGVGQLTKITAVTGMGGLGKSQLAVEFAYRYGRYYPGGVYWLNFAEPEDVNKLVAGIGGERGMNLHSEKDQLTLSKKTELVQRAWQEPIPRLLIFDNCEDENLAADWLPVSGGCSVLLTSRYSSWSKALPLKVVPLDILSRPDSVILLRNLATNISENDAHLVAAEVDDWPLALHLAGSFLEQYDDVKPQDYLHQLRGRQLLEHTSLQGHHLRYSPTRHELNVARTFALSFDRLDLADPVDGLVRQLLTCVACLAPGEPIPLTVVYKMAAKGNEDADGGERVETAVNRLSSLGFLNVVDNDNVTMHHLVALFTINSLDDKLMLVTAQQVVTETLVQQLDVYKNTDGSLVTLPISAAHLRFVTDQALAREDKVSVRLANRMSDHLIGIADFEEARIYLQAALTRTEQFYGTMSLEMAELTTNMGNLFLGMGQYKDAEPHFSQALDIRLKLLGDNHLDTALSLNNMGTVRIRLGPYESAAPYFEQALAIRERLLGSDHALTLGVMNNLGVMHNFMGDRAGARHYFEKVLAVRERTLGPDHLLTATTLNNLGDLLSRSGEEEAGRPYLERAVVVREQQLGPDHPLTLACRTNLGELLSRLGEFEAAQWQLEQARDAALPKLGENHPLTARILNTLGVLFTRMGQFEAAQIQLEQALKIREAVRGPDHKDTAYTLACLGDVYLATQNKAGAQPLLERALAILEKTVMPDEPDRLRVQAQLAALQKSKDS